MAGPPTILLLGILLGILLDLLLDLLFEPCVFEPRLSVLDPSFNKNQSRIKSVMTHGHFFEKIILPRGSNHCTQSEKNPKIERNRQRNRRARLVSLLFNCTKPPRICHETVIHGLKCHISACVGPMASPGSARGT